MRPLDAATPRVHAVVPISPHPAHTAPSKKGPPYLIQAVSPTATTEIAYAVRFAWSGAQCASAASVQAGAVISDTCFARGLSEPGGDVRHVRHYRRASGRQMDVLNEEPRGVRLRAGICGPRRGPVHPCVELVQRRDRALRRKSASLATQKTRCQKEQRDRRNASPAGSSKCLPLSAAASASALQRATCELRIIEVSHP
jgi:hypothetical protein